MPEISVLMCAYNCEQHIGEAIQSVLNQTFSDFELVVMDDGSTDGTLSVIENFHDPRIIVHRCEHNYIDTLNRGLACVSGRYLARMDADDLIPENRLAIQYALLEEYPDIDVCTAWMQLFGNNVHQQVSDSFAGYIGHPLLLMLKTNFVFNATTVCRTAFIRQHGLQFRHDSIYAEDYMFWCEAAHAGAKFFVESQVLYFYRMWANQVGRIHKKIQEESSWKVRKKVVQWLVDDLSNKDVSVFYEQACRLNETGLLSDASFNSIFYRLFSDIILSELS